jgi:hypothetical protein
MKSATPPIDPYERFVLRQYVTRLLFRNGPIRAGRPGEDTAHWLCLNARRIGMPTPRIDTDRTSRVRDRKVWSAFSKELARRCESAQPPRLSGLQRRIDCLSATLTLDQLESDILGATVRMALSRPLELLVDSANLDAYGGRVKNQALALLTGNSLAAVNRALLPNRPLALLGLITEHRGDCELSNIVIGIRLFNRDIGKGGVGLESFNEIINHPARDLINDLNVEVADIME